MTPSVNTDASGQAGPLRSRLVDVGLAALVLGVVSAAISADVNTDSAGPTPVAYLFGLGLAVLVFTRRRYPVATLLATAGLLLAYYTQDYPAIGLAVPIAIALYSAAERGRLAVSITVAGTLVVVSSVFRVAEGDDPAYLFGVELASTVGLMAVVIAWGDSVRARRGWRTELAKQARIAEVERERETHRRIEEERLRIARDLHDLLGHTISIISLHTDVARETLRDDPETAERSLAAARTATDDVVGELRATLHALRSTDDAPIPGLDRLDHLADTVRAAGLEVSIDRDGEVVPLSAVVDAAAYRVVQEAISNTLRHADAAKVVITLTYEPALLRLRIDDDGAGCEGDPVGGWGLTGMRERLALLGGGMATRSTLGEGFTVTAWIPLREG